MKEIYDFIITKEDGVTEDDLSTNFTILSKTEIAKQLNNLLRTKQIEIFNNGTNLIYKKSSSLADEERIIYQLISESKGKGLWLRDIKIKSNIPQNVVTKILRNMENKKMVKSLKTIKSNRKIYVLYEDTPAEELTGGVWFSEGEVDNEFVNLIYKVVIDFLERFRSDVIPDNLPDVAEIMRHVEYSKVSTIPINLDDLETLIKTMVYDGYVQEIIYDDIVYYRPSNTSQS